MRAKICTECGKNLSKDEVGLSRKLLGSEIFYCIDCLAGYIECDRCDLEVKIEELKEQGCALFL